MGALGPPPRALWTAVAHFSGLSGSQCALPDQALAAKKAEKERIEAESRQPEIQAKVESGSLVIDRVKGKGRELRKSAPTGTCTTRFAALRKRTPGRERLLFIAVTARNIRKPRLLLHGC